MKKPDFLTGECLTFLEWMDWYMDQSDQDSSTTSLIKIDQSLNILLPTLYKGYDILCNI